MQIAKFLLFKSLFIIYTNIKTDIIHFKIKLIVVISMYTIMQYQNLLIINILNLHRIHHINLNYV